MSATPSSTLGSKLAALTQRLGFSRSSVRQVMERAALLQLPFQPLSLPPASIWWLDGPSLQSLQKLPRSALSGPVQDDKVAAHAVLVQLVEQETQQLDSLDLREIDGLAADRNELPAYASFEEYLAGLSRRQVRIISYKDFIKAISLPLPHFLADEPISLLQSSWQGSRYFWSGELHLEAFANAIAYARRRGLEVTLPAAVTRYRISQNGLQQLDQKYHMLAMPPQAWNNSAFMSLLVDTGMPYARLSLLRAAYDAEFLMLPKHNAEATALGEGLLLAGATDVSPFLRQL